MVRRWLLRSDGRKQRYNIKGKGFSERYEKISIYKGRNLYQKKFPKKKRPAEKEAAPPPEKKIFRSYIMFAETSNRTRSGQNQAIQVRVWIHTDSSSVTEDDLRAKFFNFVAMLNLNESSIEEKGIELNREIDKDEMLPTGELGKWWAVAQFHVDREEGAAYSKNYYGEWTGTDFKESTSFTLPAFPVFDLGD